MAEDVRRMILALKPEGYDLFEKQETKICHTIDDLINSFYRNLANVDFFYIVAPDRHVERIFGSGICGLTQVKSIIVYSDTQENLQQVKETYNMMGQKLKFCLTTNVQNQIHNIQMTNMLASSGASNQSALELRLTNLKILVEQKKAQLPTRLLSTGHLDSASQTAVFQSTMQSATTTELESDNVHMHMQKRDGMLDIDPAMIETLNDGIQRLGNALSSSQNKIQRLAQDLSTLQLTNQEQNTFLNGIKPNQEVRQQDIITLKENSEAMQYTSYDGTYIWKITSVQEKMTDAQSERQTSIYSPPFYSSPSGYKMRSRLYLHGDGNARRTHMSLFFVLMRGEHDAILKFPFNFKITFCLYDQTPAQRYIIDSFRPDVKSSSFQRPRSDMNIASGIPKFFPLSIIKQEGNPYVRDGTMFIQVIVDFGDMPKTLLPYVLSLNPGLPQHEQRKLIQTHIDEDKQLRTATAKNKDDDRKISQLILNTISSSSSSPTTQTTQTLEITVRSVSPRDGRDDDSDTES